jgi:predicted nucleic acid-binding protein
MSLFCLTLRPKFEKKIAASLLSVDQLVDLYAELVVLIRPTPLPRIAPDPDDHVVIGTALSAKAHCRRLSPPEARVDMNLIREWAGLQR